MPIGVVVILNTSVSVKPPVSVALTVMSEEPIAEPMLQSTYLSESTEQDATFVFDCEIIANDNCASESCASEAYVNKSTMLS